MKISWQDKRMMFDNLSDHNGYGSATKEIQKSLTRLGYEWNYNDPTADVGFVFDQPEHCFFYPNQYKILLHPWESTRLLTTRTPDWTEQMNQCDEIWTPSPLIAEWYKELMGIKPPVYVYEHGVDASTWTPKKRKESEPFKFLHVGGEAARKGLKEAMQALRLAFPRDVKVQLTSKKISQYSNTLYLPRIKTDIRMLSINELVDMFHDHHAYVYPSYGEGFGLTPLQAMATGMPTVTVHNWAPYKDFINPNLSVEGILRKSPWPTIHPGAMFEPSMDELIEAMRYSYYNYEEVQAAAQDRVADLVTYYDWDRLTAEAFKNLEKRLEN